VAPARRGPRWFFTAYCGDEIVTCPRNKDGVTVPAMASAKGAAQRANLDFEFDS